MKRTRLFNAKILDVEKLEIQDGEIIVEDNKILYCGNDIENVKCDEEIDCEGNLLMPGFKNAHSHSAMTFLRSYCDDVTLHEWLFNNVFPLENKLTSEDVYYLTKLAVLEYLSSGITSVMDMYLYPFDAAKAFVDMNYRGVMTGCLDYYSTSVDDMKRMFNDMNHIDSLITYKIGFHSVYTISEDVLKNISIIANELKEPIFTHLCETEKEVKDCVTNHGCTPVKYLDNLGLLNNGGGFYHCIYLNEDDINLFKKYNLNAVTCPASNSKLVNGTPDLVNFEKNNIKIGVGTDGAASNNSLDMFKEMFLLSVLQKLKHNDPVSIEANEIIKFVTINNAEIMGLDECRTLKAGQLADIIMIDLAKPNMRPINNIITNLVYAGSKDIIKMTMINGKILYKDNQFLVDDIKIIYTKCQQIIERMKK
ncbi:MAG: amidohydrolase [Bacilli bacterium]